MQETISHFASKSIVNAPLNCWFYSLAESDRFIELKDAITTLQVMWGFNFEHSDFDGILVYRNILKPFGIGCTRIYSSKVTISEVISIVDEI